MNKRIGLTIATALAAVSLAACSNDEGDSKTTSSESTTAASTATSTSSATATETSTAGTTEAGAIQGEGAIQLENGTVRAKTEPGKDMTAVFGTLHNTTDKDITVTGFTTSLGEARYELHETVDGVMRPVEGGFTVPANGTFELAPGGTHMMILDYTPEIPAGDTVDITLQTSDGESIEIPQVAVRTMIPGHEDYGKDGSMVGHTMPEGTATEGDHEGHTMHEGHEGH